MIDIQIKKYKQRRDQSTSSVFCTKRLNNKTYTFLFPSFQVRGVKGEKLEVCSGPEDGLQSVGSVELFVDVIDIGLNLTEADIQLLSYFFIAGSGCNTNKHFALSPLKYSLSISLISVSRFASKMLGLMLMMSPKSYNFLPQTDLLVDFGLHCLS